MSNAVTGTDKHMLWTKKCDHLRIDVLTFVLDAQKNRLIETVLLITHIVYLDWKKRNLSFNYTLLSDDLLEQL